MTNNNILVIGGTGMLGEPVARRLKKDGYNVRILTRNPDAARQKFNADFDIFHGDVEKQDTLISALEGCHSVHVNLAGGPAPETYHRVEAQGTANVVKTALKMGVNRLTYLSESSVGGNDKTYYATMAKTEAEVAIRKSGIQYTIFRSSWFMESLPLFIQSNRATTIGKQPSPLHWVASADYAGMVSQALQTPESHNKVFYVYGPEALPMLAALKIYCSIVHPDIKVSKAPIWLVSLMATLTRNQELKSICHLMKHYNSFIENSNSTVANTILGKPTTTIHRWSEDSLKQAENRPN